MNKNKAFSRVAIDSRVSGSDYRQDCGQAVCGDIHQGRRKLLIEMATGAGKTCTPAALIKSLFEANLITRVLFLVDRIPLAKQTEDAFAEHVTRVFRSTYDRPNPVLGNLKTFAAHGDGFVQTPIALTRDISGSSIQSMPLPMSRCYTICAAG